METTEIPEGGKEVAIKARGDISSPDICANRELRTSQPRPQILVSLRTPGHLPAWATV